MIVLIPDEFFKTFSCKIVVYRFEELSKFRTKFSNLVELSKSFPTFYMSLTFGTFEKAVNNTVTTHIYLLIF